MARCRRHAGTARRTLAIPADFKFTKHFATSTLLELASYRTVFADTAAATRALSSHATGAQKLLARGARHYIHAIAAFEAVTAPAEQD